MEVFLRVSFHWDLLQLINGLTSGVQRILCPVKVASFQSSEPTWKFLLILAKTRCSISFPPVPKRSSTKRLMIPATGFLVAGLPALGSSVFSNSASLSDCSRNFVIASLRHSVV